MEKKKVGLIPPKLNSPFLLLGFTPIEWLVLVGLFIIFAISSNSFFVVLIAVLFALLFRIDGERNLVNYFKILYRYFTTPQIFDTKGVKTIYELIDQSTYHE